MRVREAKARILPPPPERFPIDKMRGSSQNGPSQRLILGRKPQTFETRTSNREEHRKTTTTGHSSWGEVRKKCGSPRGDATALSCPVAMPRHCLAPWRCRGVAWPHCAASRLHGNVVRLHRGSIAAAPLQRSRALRHTRAEAFARVAIPPIRAARVFAFASRGYLSRLNRSLGSNGLPSRSHWSWYLRWLQMETALPW